jgi:hypothetical protein
MKAQRIQNLKATIHTMEQEMFDAIGNLEKINERQADWEAAKRVLASLEG